MDTNPLLRLRPQVFERAAARILTNKSHCCCAAIADSLHPHRRPRLDSREPHQRALLYWFRPGKLDSLYYWTGEYKENQQARAIALLTMAAMVRAETQEARAFCDELGDKFTSLPMCP